MNHLIDPHIDITVVKVIFIRKRLYLKIIHTTYNFLFLVHNKSLASIIYFDYCVPFLLKGKFTTSTKELVLNVTNENYCRKLKTFDMWKDPSGKKNKDCKDCWGDDGQHGYIHFNASQLGKQLDHRTKQIHHW